ncbi:MAG TPA: molybdate ABC transporter permease subunit, partial [bacterium]|nr:molybdate ABC transporter permease subunit [bacterium]
MPSIDPWSAVRLSLVAGAWATVLGTPVALALGWLLARTRFPGKAIVSTLTLVPLVLPPVVTGVLLLRLFGTKGPLGAPLEALGVRVPFSMAGVVLAATVMALPLYVLSVRAALTAVDPRYEEVSWTLGHGPCATFRRITLPLALPGLAAGAVLAFARALGEFGATAVLAGNIEGRTRTAPMAIYTLLEVPGREGAIGWLVGATLALALLTL